MDKQILATDFHEDRQVQRGDSRSLDTFIDSRFVMRKLRKASHGLITLIERKSFSRTLGFETPGIAPYIFFVSF